MSPRVTWLDAGRVRVEWRRSGWALFTVVPPSREPKRGKKRKRTFLARSGVRVGREREEQHRIRIDELYSTRCAEVTELLRCCCGDSKSFRAAATGPSITPPVAVGWSQRDGGAMARVCACMSAAQKACRCHGTVGATSGRAAAGRIGRPLQPHAVCLHRAGCCSFVHERATECTEHRCRDMIDEQAAALVTLHHCAGPLTVPLAVCSHRRCSSIAARTAAASPRLACATTV